MNERSDPEITSAIATQAAQEELEALRRERARLKGREAKYNNLSDEEEARALALDAEIARLEKKLLHKAPGA